MLDFLNNIIVASIIKSAIIIVVLMTIFAFLTVVERKVLGRIQRRYGPNRLGPGGILQPLADGMKMMFKEQIIPTNASRFIYVLAPVISVVVALSAFAVIPFGNVERNPGPWSPMIGDINVGLLWVLAISSLAVYGIVLGGWSSGNNYSLLGALRSAAQMVSYETSQGLALSGVLMWAGTLSLTGIVRSQSIWFVLVQPLGFIIYVIAGIAEVNRAPFDLPEAEQELTAGYLTEYSGLRWSLYQMAEYINMITVSSVATTMYLGGWSLFGLERYPFVGLLAFVLKVALFLFVFIWLRATLPRIRYDQLMRFGWLVLLPLTVLNIVVTATVVAFGLPWWINGLAGVIVILALLFYTRGKTTRLLDVSPETSLKTARSVLVPSSVRLAKLEKMEQPVTEVEAVPAGEATASGA